MTVDGEQPLAGLRKISLQDLGRRLYCSRFAILGCGVAGFIFALVYLFTTPTSFTVRMSVAPPLENMSQRESIEGGALANIGLGSLVSTVSPEPFRRYENLLRSQVLAEELQRDHHILQVLFPDRWDAQTQSWKPRAGLSAMIKRLLGIPMDPPGVRDVVDFLSSNLSVTSPALASPIRQLDLRYRDPQDAAKILLWIHRGADNVVRTGTVGRTKGMIVYLKQQLPVVDNADERLALSRLLINREQDLMLAAVGLDYAAVVLDPPNADNAVKFPQPRLAITLGLFLGIGLGCIAALIGAFSFLARMWRRFLDRNLRGTSYWNEDGAGHLSPPDR
jgi:hypothetical protein